MKIKTPELTGTALDWAVATITKPGVSGVATDGKLRAMPSTPFGAPVVYSPSTDWAQGGPIIEREKIDLRYIAPLNEWHADLDCACEAGPTPLVAAMRCFVSSKLGDEVEIPEELT